MIGALKKANHDGWDEKLNRTLQEIAWQTVVNYAPSAIQVSTKR
jgi:hypothetical protein